jgi:Tfp pilus assembly protein PilF
VSGASEIGCRISKTRWHPRHSYSYVGTNSDVTWTPRAVSRRAGSWLGLALVLTAAWACAPARPVPLPETQRLQARAIYERGLGHLRDRQASLALGAFREAVALDGTVPIYHNTLGLLLLELGRPDMARESFQRALSLDPGYADAHLNLGVSMAEMGRWQEAVPRYRQALSLPTLAAEGAAHQNLGLALYHLRQYQEAERELRFAIALDPQMDAAYYNLGLVLIAAGRRTEARAAFQHVRDTAPQTPFGRAAVEQLRGLDDGG